MQKSELKELVKKYFSLTEMTEKNIPTQSTDKQVFAEAELVDGTHVTNMKDTEFEVGDELHVILEDGTHVVAPSGEHTTKSGITVTVSESGEITGIARPDEEGEGSLAEDSIEEALAVEQVAETLSAEETVSESKTELADHGEDEAMEVAEIIEAVMEVVAPQIEALKAKLADHEEKMEAFGKATSTSSVKEKNFNKEKFQKDFKTLGSGNTIQAMKARQYDAVINKNKKNK
tara:strand:- start:4442 stop:5137 length:696 start_codon:yes stop_codon:yes gene_type:complete